MISRDVRVFDDDFCRAQTLSTTPGHNGWTIKDTSSAGSPTYTVVSGEGLKLTLAATSEAENLAAYQNDVLPFDLTSVQSVDIWAKVAGIDAATVLVMGLASAQNDAPDSVATHAWVKIDGAVSTSLLVAETDDGTTDTDDKATGHSLAAVFKKITIDFSNGLSDVRFFIDGAEITSKARNTFSLAAAVAGTTFVQPYVQLLKSSGTGVGSVTIRRFRVQYRLNAGA